MEHGRKAAVLSLIIAVSASLLLSGCFHTHEWAEATCTEPRRCTGCEETEGEPLGHDWQDATCTKPRTCKRCGVTEGEPLGHDWQDATCTEPRTCKRCGETEGEPLGHDVPELSCTEGGTCLPVPRAGPACAAARNWSLSAMTGWTPPALSRRPVRAAA